MRRFESDICIIGGGISAALLAEKLTELAPGASITVVEAGNRLFDFENRMRYRQRFLEYGENPWLGDHVEDQKGEGILFRTMAVGGLALHWGGTTNRFSEEDLRLRSLYNLAVDWPLAYEELERFYCEAERRMGVAGEPGPFPGDKRSEPYPMPPMELTYNLKQLQTWAEKGGIHFWGTPVAKNTVPYDGRSICMRCATCNICPTGAKYSPDFTYLKLLDAKKLELHDRTLVRKLVLHDTKSRVVKAEARHQDRPDEPVEYEAGVFVIASGYAWSSHLLLLSANSRFPNGVANSSGLVGRYINGHSFGWADIELDAKLYPGMNETNSLVSRQFMRCPTDEPYVRHDLRIWDTDYARTARLRNGKGRVLFGDELLDDWRGRTKRASARVRGYYDVHPDIESKLTLDPSNRNRYGDPMPKIAQRFDAATVEREDRVHKHLLGVFERMARASNGKVLTENWGGMLLDHPGGGCRMGTDPTESVCDSSGRTHDHENLFVVGAPTTPTGGCTNGTLTFAALTLRSAPKIAATLS